MAALKSVFAATALAMASPFALAQSTESQTRSEEVILIADSLFENEQENSVIAEGNVEARYQGRILKADRVVYSRSTNKVRATGNVIILDPDGTERFADEVEVNSNLSDGYAIGFSVRMPNGGKAVANSAIRQEGGLNALDQVIYTSCEVCDENDTPTWALRARRAVLDEEDQMISYRDAVLEVAGIPVFYLPYFAHPDPSSDRRSGLLFPDLGVSSKVGVFYQQPYYWAISDHQELTIAPAVYEKVNPLLELDYSKRFWSGRLNINTSVTQEKLFDSDGERIEESDDSVRSHVFADGLFALNQTWDWGFGLERTSDDLYLRRYDIDGEGDQRGLYTGRPRRLLSQLFLVGQDEGFYSETAVVSVQGLKEADDNDTIPLIAPVAFTEQSFDLGNYGRASIAASAAALTRDVGADSQRVSLGGDWSQRSVLPGGILLEPFADVRADYYALDEEVSGESNVTRAVGSGGVRLSYPLMRRGEAVDILIEPVAMGAWGLSNTNTDPIPVEDSQFFEVDTSTLFASNGAAGYDLYEGDGRAAFGIRAQARWRNGVTLSTEAGRRWRSTSDPAFAEFTNLDGTVSDWVANTQIDLGDSLNLQANMRLDDDTLELNRLDAKVETSFWRFRGSAQYFRLADSMRPTGQGEEGALLRASLRVTDRFSLSYSQQRDLEQQFDNSRIIGVSYSDDCSVFTVGYQQRDSRDRDLGPSESITFRFTLRSLGAFGSSELD
ncbi:MAG: LPS assembly protein LptD [Hyphomonadaceae bacterium]|nr:LPS assembly protein LptD [Hyphomonadaceae bacterium]